MNEEFTEKFLSGAEPGGQEGAEGSGAALKEQVVNILKTIYDPEIPVNIYELGLIYDVDVAEGGKVDVKMTLTTPMCPVAETMPAEVETKVKGVDGVSDATVELVWEPPWDMNMLTDAAKLELGML